VDTNNITDVLHSMTTGTLAVTAAPVQQGRTHQLWDVRSPTRAAESSHEERLGCRIWTPALWLRASPGQSLSWDTAAGTSCVRSAGELAEIIAEFVIER
jgi:hypothetical protein